MTKILISASLTLSTSSRGPKCKIRGSKKSWCVRLRECRSYEKSHGAVKSSRNSRSRISPSLALAPARDGPTDDAGEEESERTCIRMMFASSPRRTKETSFAYEIARGERRGGNPSPNRVARDWRKHTTLGRRRRRLTMHRRKPSKLCGPRVLLVMKTANFCLEIGANVVAA